MGTTDIQVCAEGMELEDWMIFKYSDEEPREFRKQAEAIEAAATQDGLKVFAKEVNGNGRRKYFICEPNAFWAWYIHQDPKNYYEVLIREKKVKLFYDLEFSIELNGAKNHQEMTKKFIQLIIQYLESLHGVREPGRNVVVLNSSDSVKYSIHLVFPSIIFEDIRQIKTFNLLMMSSFTEEEKKLFQVQKKDGSNGSFVDNSVYSSHRNMRLFKSTKYNQSRYLKIQQYGHKEFLNNNYIHPNEEKRIFLDSLISNIEEEHLRQIIYPTPLPAAEVVSRPPDGGIITSDTPWRTPRGRHHNTSIMTEDMESAFALSASTPMPNLVGEEPMPDQGCASEAAPNASTPSLKVNAEEGSRVEPEPTKAAYQRGKRKHVTEEEEEVASPSPPSAAPARAKNHNWSENYKKVPSSTLPHIDAFVKRIIQREEGSIKAIHVGKGVIVYDIINAHFCHKKPGYHKTNNIMFKYYCKTHTLMQSCWSVNCRSKSDFDVTMDLVKFKP